MVNVGKSPMGMAQHGGHHNLTVSICGGFKDLFGILFPLESVGQDEQTIFTRCPLKFKSSIPKMTPYFS